MFGKLTLLFFKLFLISLVFGQLGRIPLGGAEGAFYINDIILVLLVPTWLIWRLAIKRKFSINFLDYTFILFIFTTFISLIFATNWVDLKQILVGFSYWLRLVFYLSLLKISADLHKEFKQDFNRIFEWLVITFAVLGLVQFAIFPDFSKYIQHGWDPHYYRVLSTFFDPNFAGLFLILGLIFFLNKIYSNKSLKRPSTLIVVSELVIIGLGIVLTFSRSSYLALVSGLGVFAWFKDKRIFIGMIMLGLITFAAIPRVRTRVIGAFNLDETVQLRLVDYSRTFAIIRDNPILGVGFNTFRYAQEKYGYFRDERGVNQPSGHAGAGADNSFLFIWATGGIISLITLLMMLTTLGLKMWQSPACALLLGSLTAVVIHAQFVNSLFYPWILAWLLVIAGTHLNTRRV